MGSPKSLIFKNSQKSQSTTTSESPIASSGTRAAAQISMGNQGFGQYLNRSTSQAAQEMIVITEEATPPECVDFFVRDPEKSDVRTGTLVHKALQNWMDRFHGERFTLPLPMGSKAPLSDKPLIIGNKNQGPGYFDLAYKSEKLGNVEGAELKPANPKGYADGINELKWYLDKGNSDEDLKRRARIDAFLPMEPWKFPLPYPLYVEGRKFRLGWCLPGVILYKEIGKKKREQERKRENSTALEPSSERQSGQRSSERARASLTAHIEAANGVNTQVVVFSEPVSVDEASRYVWGTEGRLDPARGVASKGLQPGEFQRFSLAGLPLPSVMTMRPELASAYLEASWGQSPVAELPTWSPKELSAAFRAGAIPVGLDISTWTFEWSGGFSSPLVVNRRGRIVELQVLWPNDRRFYDLYAERVGEDEVFARRLHEVCTEWNSDIVSILMQHRQNGYVSISDARDQLRVINANIARLLATGFAIAFALAASGLVPGGPPVIRGGGIGIGMRAAGPPAARGIAPPGTGDAADKLIKMLNAILERGAPVGVP